MTAINSIWNSYLTFTAPIMIIILVIIFWFRAGSIISLLERLWRLIAGKGEVADPKLMKFTKEMRDLEQFNFVYGLKVKSIEHMHQVIEWMWQYKLSYVDVRSGKKWIDINTFNIKLPTKSYINWLVAGVALCAVFMALSSITLGSKSVLLQFKESKTWFFLDHYEAQGFSENWILQSKQCNTLGNNERLVPELTESENKLICESFKDKDMIEFLRKSLHSQRLVSSWIFVMFLILMIVLMIQAQSFHAAKRIKGILNQS